MPNDTRWAAPLCAWRLKGAPCHWNVPDIKPLAKQVGFQDVEIHQKTRVRKGVAWIFKAKRSDDLNVLQQTVDWNGGGHLGDVEIVKEATRRGQSKSSPCSLNASLILLCVLRNTLAIDGPPMTALPVPSLDIAEPHNGKKRPSQNS